LHNFLAEQLRSKKELGFAMAKNLRKKWNRFVKMKLAVDPHTAKAVVCIISLQSNCGQRKNQVSRWQKISAKNGIGL